MNKKVTAFAPATVANLSVGFDVLGVALNSLGDKITVQKTEEKSVFIKNISGVETGLPTDPRKNTATLPLLKMIEDLNLNFGFSLEIEKGIPVSSGLGGSAASAVASVMAANQLLNKPLTKEELIPFSIEGEALASGSKHADNVAPSLLGGLILITSLDPFKYIRPPLPETMNLVVWHPHIKVETKRAREILKKHVSLSKHIEQSKNLGGFIAGLYKKDYQILKDCFNDIVIEPQRKHLIPYFDEAKKIAQNHEAIGLSISGGGPSLFALARNKKEAIKIEKEVSSFFKEKEMLTDSYLSTVNQQGCQIL